MRFTASPPAFSTEDLLGKIEAAKTAEWLEGLAHLVTKELIIESRPTNTVSRVEMRKVINRMKMGRQEDPKNLKERLRAIENRFNYCNKKIEEGNLVATILAVAPVQYASVLGMA